MHIETKRLIVRDFRESDAEALYKLKTDEQVLKFVPDFLDVDAGPEDAVRFIREFDRIEAEGDTETWRCYAIEHKTSRLVVGCLCFARNDMLFEYELGWMMLGEHAGNGYASEAAEAFAEYICEKCALDYLIVVMDVDNPASYRCALKAGFRLFEKRTVYDYSLGRYADDYYYFRRYFSKCTRIKKFYGDVPYYGRTVNAAE